MAGVGACIPATPSLHVDVQGAGRLPGLLGEPSQLTSLDLEGSPCLVFGGLLGAPGPARSLTSQEPELPAPPPQPLWLSQERTLISSLLPRASHRPRIYPSVLAPELFPSDCSKGLENLSISQPTSTVTASRKPAKNDQRERQDVSCYDESPTFCRRSRLWPAGELGTALSAASAPGKVAGILFP